MVIATASACLAVDQARRTVAIALGSVGPTIIRCRDAEALAAAGVDWERGTAPGSVLDDVAAAAAAASRPIDDHRSTADYRRRAVAVMARRLARRAFAEVSG
jgi:CO/xanthine dehydrogenase FAD-binding subunit